MVSKMSSRVLDKRIPFVESFLIVSCIFALVILPWDRPIRLRRGRRGGASFPKGSVSLSLSVFFLDDAQRPAMHSSTTAGGGRGNLLGESFTRESINLRLWNEKQGDFSQISLHKSFRRIELDKVGDSA